jgi:hypothetical protein
MFSSPGGEAGGAFFALRHSPGGRLYSSKTDSGRKPPLQGDNHAWEGRNPFRAVSPVTGVD